MEALARSTYNDMALGYFLVQIVQTDISESRGTDRIYQFIVYTKHSQRQSNLVVVHGTLGRQTISAPYMLPAK